LKLALTIELRKHNATADFIINGDIQTTNPNQSCLK
jgi:hypothetical protein